MFRNIIFTLLSLLATSSAQAYVCSQINGADISSPSLWWATRTLSYALNPNGTSRIVGNGELQTLRASFDVWSELSMGSDSLTCNTNEQLTDIQFVEQAYNGYDIVGYDYLHPEHNQNTLVFRDNNWRYNGSGSGIIALTTSTYSAATGEILDADIEFNSQYFAFVTSNPSGNQQSLKNTAVHEIGHFLGFAHSSVLASTMYAQAGPADTQKEDLHCDDRAIMVLKYPAGEPNGSCHSLTSECRTCQPAGTLTSNVLFGIQRYHATKSGCVALSNTSTLLMPLLVYLCLRSRRTLFKQLS